MNDRELLELAAKAAGLDYRHADGEIRYGAAAMKWNPVMNDGAALRLAAKLQITIDYHELGGLVICKGNPGPWIDERLYPQGREAATRRAIVRAAAEIGKAMP